MDVFAILASAVVYMIIGFLWYSPLLFGSIRLKLKKTEQRDLRDQGRAMAMSIINAVILSFSLAFIFDLMNIQNFLNGFFLVIFVWVGFVFPFTANEIIFGDKNRKLFLLDSANQLFSLLVMSLILSFWH